MDDDVHGVQATIIDLGLARMDSHERDNSAVHWTTFEPEVFEGEGILFTHDNNAAYTHWYPLGDYQFDIYRLMRAHNGDSWKEYRPLTNVMVSPFVCDVCSSR